MTKYGLSVLVFIKTIILELKALTHIGVTILVFLFCFVLYVLFCFKWWISEEEVQDLFW